MNKITYFAIIALSATSLLSPANAEEAKTKTGTSTGAPAVGGDIPPAPPPPPPVGAEQTSLNSAQKISKEVNGLEGLYNNYSNALTAYNLSSKKSAVEATEVNIAATNDKEQALLKAATALGKSLENIRRWAVSLAKETQFSPGGEVTKAEKKWIRQKDPKESAALIEELQKRFQQSSN